MEKNFLMASVFMAGALSCAAQLNVQLHYDLGHAMYGGDLDNRPRLTATVENFTADRWGSTYFFIDADFGNKTMRGAYAELSRELQFWKAPVAAHVEYNGGLNGFGSYKDSYLVGPAYNWNSKDFASGVSLQVLYKYLAKNGAHRHSWQVTGVWRHNFAKNLCTFSGFVDVWHDVSVDGNLIVMSEPQFWFNLAPLKLVPDDCKFSVGAEVEISNNFVWPVQGRNNRFYAIPTLACKWTF